MSTVTFAIKQQFFDRAAVMEAVGKARAKALSRAGAYVRRTARTKLRKKKKASSPGQPPSTHSAEPNLKTILFAWDSRSDAVIIGPVKLNGSFLGDKTLPNVLELGGKVELRERRWVESRRLKPTDAEWKTMGARARKKQRDTRNFEYRSRTVRIAKRPFMKPSLEENQAKFPDLFKNAIKG